jgi:ribosomal protein S1
LPFIEFVGSHPVGSAVTAEVERFSSHGAYVRVDDLLCYVPLKSMADPAPRRARDVLTIGEAREFIVQRFDPPHRGVDLALRGYEVLTDTALSADEVPDQDNPVEEAPDMAAPAKKTAAKKTAAKKAPAKKTAAKKAPAKKTAAKKAPAR